jgi:hypothetical protein
MMYWNDKGTYQAEAEALSALVPGEGNAETHKGEVWRAASKIYYDYFNNGFGNFWRRPAAFLITHVKLSDEVLELLYEHANGNVADTDTWMDKRMDEMIDLTIVALRDIEDRPNTTDMWDFEADWELDCKFAEEEDFLYEEDGAY